MNQIQTGVDAGATRGSLNLGVQVWGQFVSWEKLMATGSRTDELGDEVMEGRARTSVGRLDDPHGLGEYASAGAEEVVFDWPTPADDETLLALAGPIRDALQAHTTDRVGSSLSTKEQHSSTRG